MFSQISPLAGGLVLVVGIAIGYVVRQVLAKQRASSAEQKVELQLENAKKEAAEIVLQAKDKAVKTIEDSLKEEKDRKAQIERLEERILKREESADGRMKEADDRQKKADEQSKELD